MKVLKLKDPSTFKNILTKRGNNLIVPVVDSEGNFVLGLNILEDPIYEDLYEDILDLCETIEYIPLEIDKVDEKPIKQKKNEFKTIKDISPTLEDAIASYYKSKKGLLAKGVDIVINAGRTIANFFTSSNT